MHNLKNILFAGTILLAGACADTEVVDTSSSFRPELSAKEISAKADQWNAANNPERFRTELNYKFDELPTEGRSEHVPWPADYWPTYKDAFNKRWQGADKLSPVEKYDAAFHGWDPARVEGLRPMKPGNCKTSEWDTTYYDNLGPSANYNSDREGFKDTREAATRGELKDNCYAKDDGECVTTCNDNTEMTDQERTYCKSRCNRGGVETWWGKCHAWVPAAMLEKEPIRAVEHNGQTFEVSDIKALLIAKYDRGHAYMIGGRCNDREVKRDETTGRVLDDECRDTNAGAWHVVMANFLGVMKRSVAEDRTYNYEVWNQPIIEWKVNEMKEIDMARARELLKFEGDVYPYNDAAKKLYEVKATSYYITESHPSAQPFTDTVSTYTRADKYHYILEIDAEGNINGGEWVGQSNTDHPDFLWLPTSPGGGNPYIDLSTVRMLLEKSRQPVTENPADDSSDIVVVENTFEFNIPDNDPNGVSSTIDVENAGTSGKIEVEVNIEHSYIGDLKVELRKDGRSSLLHSRTGGSQDNLKKTFTVNDMAGINLQGTWELKMSDHAGQDVGTLKGWKIKFHTGSAPANANGGVVTGASPSPVAIVDNNPEGVVSTINIAESKTIKRMKVTVNISHTYVGALIVELKHGAVTKTLHNMEDGDETSIQKVFNLEEFTGDLTAGAWELKVIDTDAYDDSGSIDSWTVEFTY